MKTSTRIFLGALTAVSIVLPQVKAQEVVAARTTIITACGKLFSIDANAAGLTPEQRASIVQKNLDNALIAAKHRSPDAVAVTMMNRNPVVTVDGFYIATADANCAARDNMTQLQLAQKWADSIRFCLADATAIKNYIAMLSGHYPVRQKVVSTATSTDVAVLPWGTTLPVTLTAPLAVDDLLPGSDVQAELSTDVPLPPHFNAYLPTGTLALGKIVDAAPFNCNNVAGKHALMASFYALQTPDGKEIPINGHILGGVNSWRYVSVQPIQPNCCLEAGKAKMTSYSYGPGARVTSTTTTACAPMAQSGTITGAWRGNSEDLITDVPFQRMLLSRNTGLVIPTGAPLFLQLSSSSSMAINSAAPAGVQLSSVGVGM